AKTQRDWLEHLLKHPREKKRLAMPSREDRPRPELSQGRGPIVRRNEPLPAERLPLVLEVTPNENYALIDSGDGQKLEQYGPYRIVRPEGQAIWRPALSETEWLKADAIFTGDTDEEGMGRWRFPKTPL